MQITRQADYAVRAVLYLARLNGKERAATSQVAKEQHIPPSFLAKIISQLSIAGLLHTSRGARGGVTLAREPEAITLLEVIEAIDGPIMLNECVGENSMGKIPNSTKTNGITPAPMRIPCSALALWVSAPLTNPK